MSRLRQALALSPAMLLRRLGREALITEDDINALNWPTMTMALALIWAPQIGLKLDIIGLEGSKISRAGFAKLR